MQLDYGVIEEALSNAFGAGAATACRENATLSLPALMGCESDPGDSNLLVVGAECRDRVSRMRGKLLVLVGEGWDASSRKALKSDWIHVPKASSEQVFSCLLSLYAHAFEWIALLTETLEENGSIQAILDKACEVAGIPLLYYDEKLEELHVAISEKDDALATALFPSHAAFRGGFVSLEQFDNAMLQANLAKTGPFYLRSEFPGSSNIALSLNMPVHGDGVNGVVGMVLLHGEASRFDEWRLTKLAEVIEKHYRNTAFDGAHGRSGIHGALRGLLDRTADRLAARRQIEAVWGTDCTMACCMVELKGPGGQEIPFAFLCAKIEEELAGSACAVDVEGALVVLVHGADGPSVRKVVEGLAKLAVALQARVGCSNFFENVIPLPSYRVQAQRALELCGEESVAGACCWFSDVAVDYILRYGSTELETSFLVAPGFSSLVEYSAHSSVDYCETLRRYLVANGNVSQVARECFVNRSTLLFRLRQIEAITGMSLDNEHDRLWLALSLRL